MFKVDNDHAGRFSLYFVLICMPACHYLLDPKIENVGSRCPFFHSMLTASHSRSDDRETLSSLQKEDESERKRDTAADAAVNLSFSFRTLSTS